MKDWFNYYPFCEDVCLGGRMMRYAIESSWEHGGCEAVSHGLPCDRRAIGSHYSIVPLSAKTA